MPGFLGDNDMMAHLAMMAARLLELHRALKPTGDVTHLAISLIEKRLRDAFPGIAFTVEGTPKDLASAEDLALRDKHQFQLWAVSMVDALPLAARKRARTAASTG